MQPCTITACAQSFTSWPLAAASLSYSLKNVIVQLNIRYYPHPMFYSTSTLSFCTHIVTVVISFFNFQQ